MLDHNISIELKKSFYNKTVLSEDGVTHRIDTSRSYPMYQLSIFKNYTNIDSSEVIPEIIKDLRDIADELEKRQQDNSYKENNDSHYER